MINATQLRLEIIRPVLNYLAPLIPYSVAAENLLMGTCAQESRMGSYVKQVEGPACGIFQMEPATEKDIHNNYLEYRSRLHSAVTALRAKHKVGGLNDLVGNLFYQTAMARIHYYRVPMAMPDAYNVEQLAHYWKLYYNTPEGRGTIDEFGNNYLRYLS